MAEFLSCTCFIFTSQNAMWTKKEKIIIIITNLHNNIYNIWSKKLVFWDLHSYSFFSLSLTIYVCIRWFVYTYNTSHSIYLMHICATSFLVYTPNTGTPLLKYHLHMLQQAHQTLNHTLNKFPTKCLRLSWVRMVVGETLDFSFLLLELWCD